MRLYGGAGGGNTGFWLLALDEIIGFYRVEIRDSLNVFCIYQKKSCNSCYERFLQKLYTW